MSDEPNVSEQNDDNESQSGGEDVSALKNALARKKKEAADAKRQLAAFEGIDPDEYRTLKEREEELERQQAEAKGKYDEALQKATAKLQKQVEDAEAKASDLQQRYESRLKRTEAQQAIVEAGGEDLELLGEYVERRLKVDGEDVRVVDEKGDFRDNEDGEPMTVSQFVEELKGRDGFKKLFRGRGSSGTGMTGFSKGQSGTATAPTNGKQMSPAQAAEYIREHGAEAYQQAISK